MYEECAGEHEDCYLNCIIYSKFPEESALKYVERPHRPISHPYFSCSKGFFSSSSLRVHFSPLQTQRSTFLLPPPFLTFLFSFTARPRLRSHPRSTTDSICDDVKRGGECKARKKKRESSSSPSRAITANLHRWAISSLRMGSGFFCWGEDGLRPRKGLDRVIQRKRGLRVDGMERDGMLPPAKGETHLSCNIRRPPPQNRVAGSQSQLTDCKGANNCSRRWARGWAGRGGITYPPTPEFFCHFPPKIIFFRR